MSNRALQAKSERAMAQRLDAGHLEGTKACYLQSKMPRDEARALAEAFFAKGGVVKRGAEPSRPRPVQVSVQLVRGKRVEVVKGVVFPARDSGTFRKRGGADMAWRKSLISSDYRNAGPVAKQSAVRWAAQDNRVFRNGVEVK